MCMAANSWCPYAFGYMTDKDNLKDDAWCKKSMCEIYLSNFHKTGICSIIKCHWYSFVKGKDTDACKTASVS